MGISGAAGNLPEESKKVLQSGTWQAVKERVKEKREAKQEKAIEIIQNIELYKLIPYKDHPFNVTADQALRELAESIKREGVTSPGIARLLPDGNYELIAGHRRKRASELAGKETMPVIVRELDDDEAAIIMIDDNFFNRKSLLPSEKAWAYRMKLEAMHRKAGRRSEKNLGQIGQDLTGKASVDIVAEEVGESRKQVQRYIRLTELISSFLDMVDEKKMPFNVAVELSYLQEEEQQQVVEYLDYLNIVPTLKQAESLKKKSQEKKLTLEEMWYILDVED